MGHWYLPSGDAFHFQENGKATTLRDARKVNAAPSVTTVLGILDKPALTNWKLKQVTAACWDDNALEDIWIDYDVYHKEIMLKAFQQSTDQRDRGSEIHDCIEQIILREQSVIKQPLDGFDEDIIEIAIKALDEICAYTDLTHGDLIPEKTVYCTLGYGGMIDCYDKGGRFLIDWKTKDGIVEGKNYAFPDHARQLAAYERGLNDLSEEYMRLYGISRRRCINVFIDRQVPGAISIKEWKPEEIEKAWDEFSLCLKLWQSMNNYIPGESNAITD